MSQTAMTPAQRTFQAMSIVVQLRMVMASHTLATTVQPLMCHVLMAPGQALWTATQVHFTMF